MNRDQIIAKVERLAILAQSLRRGEHFSITRLTVLKSLCGDPVTTARFGIYLTSKNRAKSPKQFRPLINQAVGQAEAHLKKPNDRSTEALWDALSVLRASQSEIEHHRWTDVRIIHSKEALLAEYAVKCILQPEHSPHWGYQMAAIHAERYNPRYGTGLIPESAPAVQDIHRFWSRHRRAITGPARSARIRLGAEKT